MADTPTPPMPTEPQTPTPLPPSLSDIVEVRVRSGSGRLLHSHQDATQAWALPGGEVVGKETPAAAATRSLMAMTGYSIPQEALELEGIVADGDRKKHVFNVSAGKGRQSGKPTTPIMWRLQEEADIKPDVVEKAASATSTRLGDWLMSRTR